MSSRDDELWARVNEALDDRQEPLSDPEVLALLAWEPERTDEIEALTRALEIVGRTPEHVRSRAVPRHAASTGRAVAASAALVIVIAGLSWWATQRAPSPPLLANPPLRAIDVVKPFTPDASPIVSWSVSVERREADVTSSDSVDPEGVRITDTLTHESDAGSARVIVHSFTRSP